MTPEFSRLLDVRRISGDARQLSASEAERAALAERFDLVSINRFEAVVTLIAEGDTIRAQGRIIGELVQSCAVSGEPLEVRIDEPVQFRFVPASSHSVPDEEVELDEEDCDEIEFSGGTIDLGEALAQSLGLAIDPFATGPEADRARTVHGLLGEDSAGPFAALAALKKPG